MTDRRHISTRERVNIFASNDGVCHICGGKIHPGEAWEVSHPIALANGGEDTPENRKPAHKKCHRHLTSTIDIPAIAKTKRRHAKHIGAKQRTGFRGWRKFNQTLVWKDRA